MKTIESLIYYGLLIYAIVLSLDLNSKNTRIDSLETELAEVKEKLERCHVAYVLNEDTLDCLQYENAQWNNHAVRMQYIAGVKNPDTVFTWKEKVVHGLDTKRLTKYTIR